jgi:hypothetical protein
VPDEAVNIQYFILTWRKMESFGHSFIFGEWKIFGHVKKKIDYGHT